MKERLISFTDDMQQASRDGRKTQARRVVELKYYDYLQFNTDGVWQFEDEYGDIHDAITKCPYGVVGDRLRSGDLLLEITGLRVERLQCLSREDALAEGIEVSSWAYSCSPYRNYMKDKPGGGELHHSTPEMSVMSLWDSINGKKHPWKSNPFVWVIEFKRIDK